MAGVNKVILIGNLGADPEVRHLQNGTPVANIRLATSETFKDRTTGERREQTEWHNVVLWRGLAEITEKYLRKGSKVYIEGKLRTRQWQDKDNNTRYTTEIVADEMTMLDRASDSGSGPVQGAEQRAAVMSGGAQRPAQQAPAPVSDPAADEMDDLPF